MVGYAIDRDASRELCERHLGAPPEELPLPATRRLGRGLATLAGQGPALVLLVVAVLGVAAVAGVVMLPGSTTGGPDVTDGVATPSVATVTPTAARPVAAGAGVGEPPGFVSAGDSPPPGVTEGGLTNVEALARAHSTAMVNRSHTVWVDRYRPPDTNLSGTAVQRDIDIAAAGERYLIVTTDIADGGEGQRRLLGALYADGATRYGAVFNRTIDEYDRVFRIDSRYDLSPTPETVRERIVTQYLSTPRSNLTAVLDRDGQRLYRITGSGRPDSERMASVSNYTVTALVDSRGFVRNLDATYTETRRGVSYRVRRTLTYDRLNTTTVRPPAWYQRREELIE